MEKIKIMCKGKNFIVEARKLSYLGKIRGLMFRRPETDNLLFEFRNDGIRGIHSFFVSFSFVALWLDSSYGVLELKVVKPFTRYVAPRKKFRYLIELPINTRNEKIIKMLKAVKR